MREQLLVHYDEIALKGGNRLKFETALMRNLELSFRGFADIRIQREFGRLLLFVQTKSEDRSEVITRMKTVFGVANFSFVQHCPPKLSTIVRTANDLLSGAEPFTSFRVTTRRVEKRLPFTSQEVNEKVGDAIRTRFGSRVDLKKSEKTIFIEVMSKTAFLYCERFTGLGGLPVGSSGKVLVLLSSGIDSPVAAFRMLGRGCSIEAAHFHSYPMTDRSSQNKVGKIQTQLQPFHTWIPIPLHFFPLAEFQQIISQGAPEALRVLLYRYGMFQIAQRLALDSGCQALVTGESLGQVASQTLSNLYAVTSDLLLPVLRPLIGMSKAEIISQAKEIGTFPISILPDQDCCSLFTPRHPETHATFSDLKPIIKALQLDAWISEHYASFKPQVATN